MTNQKNNHNNSVPHKNQVNQSNKEDDTYSILKQAIEVDSVVNEDPNRERLYESVDAFLEPKDDH